MDTLDDPSPDHAQPAPSPEPAAPGLLSRTSIIEAAKWEQLDVAVPEWGGTVRLREQPADDIAAWQRKYGDADTDRDDGVSAMAALIALSAVDGDGRRLFNQDDEDIRALKRKGVKALKRVFDAALDVNAISNKAVEDAEKN